MVISKNSQLGLRMDDVNVQIDFLTALKNEITAKKDKVDNAIEIAKGIYSLEVETDDTSYDLNSLIRNREIAEKITLAIGGEMGNFIDNKDSKLYLICDGVDKCSKMIRIGDNFSSRALRNIQFGKHTYLLGKNEMCRFLCNKGCIKGVYWNTENNAAFEFGFDLESDGYYFDTKYSTEFNKITKIITFVELGDIEVTMLESGRNNHKPKKSGKITNTSVYTVYVVDSSWNKLIIRTTGFAVMGHFRLQSCGEGFKDRKLIWINAFEKHGYKRRPKAEILNT